MSNEPGPDEFRLSHRTIFNCRHVVCLMLLVLSTWLAGCRLWDPEQPGGKTAKLTGFGSVPRQTEPVLDPDEEN